MYYEGGRRKSNKSVWCNCSRFRLCMVETKLGKKEWADDGLYIDELTSCSHNTSIDRNVSVPIELKEKAETRA